MREFLLNLVDVYFAKFGALGWLLATTIPTILVILLIVLVALVKALFRRRKPKSSR